MIRIGRFYLAAIAVLALLLGALLSVILDGSRQAVGATAEHLRRAATDAVSRRVAATFGQGEAALTDVEAEVGHGIIDVARADTVETALVAELLRQPQLAEVALTWATATGWDGDDIVLAPGRRGQVSAWRELDGVIATSHTHEEDGRWVADTHREGAPLARGADAVEDPTEHATFQGAATKHLAGAAVWSELYQLAGGQKVVSVQKAIHADGAFVGVARAVLLAREIDAVSRMRVSEEPDDPHRIFLADRMGRLITPFGPGREVDTDDEGIRFLPDALEPAVAAALAKPEPGLTRKDGMLVSLAALPDTRDWLVGIAVPEHWYLAPLEKARNRVLLVAGILAVGLFAGGAISLRALRDGLKSVAREAESMRRFNFGSHTQRSFFAEVGEVLGSLEVAKTALRAMGRYVPVELVRLLYRDGREPELGGAATEISLLFCDIKDFTSFSEMLPPDQLARALGQYLEVVGAAIHDTGGTIDKFIGDAVMVMWNAPVATPEHARRACRAALACRTALRDLYASPAWAGGKPWTTRFGLHRDTVLVGHFGAPDRMSYTAIGDGVNLASRIEGLNKVYGTEVLVSEAIQAAAGDDFVFRRVDRVAVKGKARAVELYELVGLRGQVAVDGLGVYEQALDAYLAGRFAAALDLLERLPGDGPSRALAERCRRLAADPPAAWDGVYRAEAK